METATDQTMKDVADGKFDLELLQPILSGAYSEKVEELITSKFEGLKSETLKCWEEAKQGATEVKKVAWIFAKKKTTAFVRERLDDRDKQVEALQKPPPIPAAPASGAAAAEEACIGKNSTDSAQTELQNLCDAVKHRGFEGAVGNTTLLRFGALA